jgi:hypothetical protein
MRAPVDIAAADPEYIQLAAHMFAIAIDEPFCVRKVKHRDIVLVHRCEETRMLAGISK